jgi:hypothetical protein
MLRRASVAVAAVFVFLMLTAMGGKGGGFERAPRVDRNFSVVVTDVTGSKIGGEKFSWEGRTRFSGYMGAADVNIPFEKIREVSVGEKRDRKVRVTARLNDGGEAIFDVDAESRCYGESGFGTFMLTMSEIKSINFQGLKYNEGNNN